MKTKKAAILSRVSTDKQEYDRQLDDLVALAKQDGYTIPKELIYAEKISGFSDIEDRVELSRLLTDIRTGEQDFKMIYVWEVSRIAREPINTLQVVKQATDLGVNIHINGVGKTLNEDGTENTNTALVLGMFAQMAKSEAQAMKARFKSGKRQNAKKGKFTGGNFHPFGYSKTEDSYLTIDPTESEIIKRIFQLSIDGYGCSQIAQALMRDGIKTKGGLSFWDAKVIHHIIQNPLYKGQREYVVKVKHKKIKDGNGKEKVIRDRLRSEYETFDLPELAIVSEQTWEAANQAIKDRGNKKERNVRYLYLLNHKVQCGVCGSSYHAKYTVKSQYYMCYNRKFKGAGSCDNAGLGIELFESIAWTVLRNQPYIIEHLKNNQTDLRELNKKLDKLQNSIDAYEFEIASKEKERKKVINLVLKEMITEDEGDAMLKDLNNAVTSLKAKQKSAGEQIKVNNQLIKKMDTADNYLKMIENIKDDRLGVNEIFNNVLDRVIINSFNPEKKQTACNLFLLSLYLFGKDEPITVLFNRKQNTITYGGKLDDVIYYEGNVLQDNLTDVVEIIANQATFKSGKKSRHVVNVETLPFEKMNVLEEEGG